MKLRMKSILLYHLNLAFNYTYSDRIVFTHYILADGSKAHHTTLKQYKLITKKL